MISISTTLLNFRIIPLLTGLFNELSIHYEYSESGILHYYTNPMCPKCGQSMNQNGYNYITKRHIGSIKVGKYLCSNCKTIVHTDINFWSEQISQIKRTMCELLMCLKNGGNSYRRMGLISQFILPFKKSSLYEQFSKIIEEIDFSPSVPHGKIAILNFDEEYIKISGKWKYRLTLLNNETKIPIAEKVVKKLTNKNIRDFIKSSFNPEQYDKVFVVTDLKPGYKEIFISLFGDKLIHQYCLFHLYQLICKEFPKNSSLSELLQQYKLMNIFYDYELEVQQIEKMVQEEKNLGDMEVKELRTWTRMKKDEIFDYFSSFRDSNSNKLREPIEAYYKMLEVYEEYDDMPINIQKRIDMIDESILNFLAYRSIPGAPATNNAIEGYFSTTTNPILKRQMKTEKGAENMIKSQAIERSMIYMIKKGIKMFIPQNSLIELIIPLRLLGNPI
jgi:transposase-like protein